MSESATSPKSEHKFVVTVSGCSYDEAVTVMGERISYDEDYGFEYQIDWSDEP